MTDSITEQLQQSAKSNRDYIVSWVANRKNDVLLWSEQKVMAETAYFLKHDIMDEGGFFFLEDVNVAVKHYKKRHPYYEEIGLVTE